MSKHLDVAVHFVMQDKPKLSSGSMSFRGDRAFSWGTPVAVLLRDPDIVLIKPAGWHSWSTSTHCGWIETAAKKTGFRVFRVPAVDPIDHAKNLNYLNDILVTNFVGLSKARSAHEHWQAMITHAQKQLGDYRAIFNVRQMKEAA